MKTQLQKNSLITAFPTSHWWYHGKGSLEIHHCIDCDAVTDKYWEIQFKRYNYDINHRENLVVLPGTFKGACQLHVARHRSNHGEGRAFESADLGPARVADKPRLAKLKRDEKEIVEKRQAGKRPKYAQIARLEKKFMKYPKAVKYLLKNIKVQLAKGKFCNKNQTPANQDKLFQDQMEKISSKILGYIRTFKWTITQDGRDNRKGGCGCSNQTSMDDKLKYRGKLCTGGENGRDHNLNLPKKNLKMGQ